MLAPVLVTPPAETPIDLEDAKRVIGITHSDDDGLITAFIEAATEWLDGYSGVLGRALVDQTWKISMSGMCRRVLLPLAPVSAITSVTYYDPDGAQQTVAPGGYGLFADAAGPYLQFVHDYGFPALYAREDAVSVTVTAGYGSADDVPAPIRQAIRMLVAGWYENRESASPADMNDVPYGVSALIAPYRRVSI